MTTDLTTLTTQQLQSELNRRADEARQQALKEQKEKNRIARELAEVGKKEALAEVAELKDTIAKSAARIEELAKKHMLYVEMPWGQGTLEISQWGLDASGWDSSSC